MEPVEVVIARQRLGTRIFAATNQHLTVKELMEAAFSMRFARTKKKSGNLVSRKLGSAVLSLQLRW
jgi:hypothetical protein